MRERSPESRDAAPGPVDITSMRPRGPGLAVPPAPRQRVLGPGDVIAGYELIQRVKSGGMGSLWVARRSGVGGFAKHVAIKIIHPHLGENQDFVRMFLDEARLTGRIAHPNVIQVFDVGVEHDAYFMVMELITGCSLADVAQLLADRGRRLQPELAVAIVREVANGLHAAHELRGERGQPLGVVHRDVTPENVLVGVHGAVRLIDFGIAMASERLHETRQPTLKGKLRYLAPEQLGGTIDRRTDIFSLGIVLWELLTGQRLYEGQSEVEILDHIRAPMIPLPSQMIPGAPRALDRALAMMTALSPDARPKTAADAAVMLLAAMPGAAAVGPSHVAQLANAATTGGAGVSQGIETAMPPAELESFTAERGAAAAYTTGRILLPQGPPASTVLVAPARAPIVSTTAVIAGLILVVALVIGWQIIGTSSAPEIRARALEPQASAPPSTVAPPRARDQAIAPLPARPISVTSASSPTMPLPIAPLADPAPTSSRPRTPVVSAPERRAPARPHEPRTSHRASVVDGTTLAHEL